MLQLWVGWNFLSSQMERAGAVEVAKPKPKTGTYTSLAGVGGGAVPSTPRVSFREGGGVQGKGEPLP